MRKINNLLYIKNTRLKSLVFILSFLHFAYFFNCTLYTLTFLFNKSRYKYPP